jgi:hypothetical protein
MWKLITDIFTVVAAIFAGVAIVATTSATTARDNIQSWLNLLPGWVLVNSWSLAILFTILALSIWLVRKNKAWVSDFLWTGADDKPLDVAVPAKNEATPNLSAKDLFVELYQDITSASEYEQNGYASEVRDKLALGLLTSWGRDDDAPRNPGEHAPPKEIPRDYWQKASLRPRIFLGNDEGDRYLVHAAPPVGIPGPHYRDVWFNRAQTRNVWPELAKR